MARSGSVFAVLAVHAAAAIAQPSLLVVNVAYEAPDLVAPVVFYVVSPSDATRWTVGQAGWTTTGSFTSFLSPNVTTFLSLDVTPLNAHSSDRIYVNGDEDPSLEFENRTILASAGVTIEHGDGWTLRAAVRGLYESVTDLPAGVTVRDWSRPFAGIEIAESFSFTRSDDLLRNRWDGVKGTVRTEVYAGSFSWWRATADVGVGRKWGPVFARLNGSLLTGNGLDMVSRFLAGGCWDLSGVYPVYGYRYGQYRLDRCALLWGGADLAIADGLEVSVRSSVMTSPSTTVWGSAVQMAAIWGGIGLAVGLGVPESGFGDGVIFGGISGAVFP